MVSTIVCSPTDNCHYWATQRKSYQFCYILKLWHYYTSDMCKWYFITTIHQLAVNGISTEEEITAICNEKKMSSVNKMFYNQAQNTHYLGTINNQLHLNANYFEANTTQEYIVYNTNITIQTCVPFLLMQALPSCNMLLYIYFAVLRLFRFLKLHVSNICKYIT